MNTLSTKSAFIFIILIAFSFPLSAQEKEKGKLADFEEEVEKGSDSNDSDDYESTEYDDYDSNDDDCDDCDISNFFLFLDISHAIGDGLIQLLFISDLERENGITKVGYSDFPYCGYSDGLYDKSSLKKYSIHTNYNYFRESDKLTAFNFNARLSPHPAIAVELNYSDFTEKLKTRYDHLRMYDFFINYNRLKFENIALWWGIGYKGFMGDRSHGGFAFNLGTNLFLPNTPVSLSINYNIASIESTGVTDFASKIKYHINRTEISLGYRLYKAGQISINGLTLGVGFYL